MIMDKAIKISSRIISGITFPLLMPTYAMLLVFTTTFMSYLPGKPVITVLLVTFGATVMLPVIAIYVLRVTRVISDPLLNNQRDRTIPYIFTAIIYGALAGYLWHIGAPVWMIAFMLGAMAVLGIITCINLVWKISGHAAGMGGLTALAVFLAYRGYSIEPGLWIPSAIIILSGLVCTARLLLDRHSLLQVTAGYFLSLTVVYLAMLLAN